MNSNFQDNAAIPEVQAMMGKKQKYDPSFITMLIDLLRNKQENAALAGQVPPPQPPMPPPQPTPNAMPGGGGFNPNNRPGMQGL